MFANFITITLFTISYDFKNPALLILAMIAFTISLLAKYFKKSNEKLSSYLPFFLFSIAWFLTPYWWLGLINLFFGVLNTMARRKLAVYFYNDNLIYPSTFPQKILWTEINNVILKDGILTIDLKNNKLFQHSIDRTYTTINEKEFNEFCRQHLNQ